MQVGLYHSLTRTRSLALRACELCSESNLQLLVEHQTRMRVLSEPSEAKDLSSRPCFVTLLESAFTLCDALSPLESAFTQTTRGGGSPSQEILKFHLKFCAPALGFFMPRSYSFSASRSTSGGSGGVRGYLYGSFFGLTSNLQHLTSAFQSGYSPQARGFSVPLSTCRRFDPAKEFSPPALASGSQLIVSHAPEIRPGEKVFFGGARLGSFSPLVSWFLRGLSTASSEKGEGPGGGVTQAPGGMRKNE